MWHPRLTFPVSTRSLRSGAGAHDGRGYPGAGADDCHCYRRADRGRYAGTVIEASRTRFSSPYAVAAMPQKLGHPKLTMFLSSYFVRSGTGADDCNRYGRADRGCHAGTASSLFRSPFLFWIFRCLGQLKKARETSQFLCIPTRCTPTGTRADHGCCHCRSDRGRHAGTV